MQRVGDHVERVGARRGNEPPRLALGLLVVLAYPWLVGSANAVTVMHLHFRRGGGRGVLNLLRQTMVILDQLGPEHQGVTTGELIDAYLQELESRKQAGAGLSDRWLAPKIPYR